MSATEIIAEIEKLSAPEQDRVFQFLAKERKQRGTSPAQAKYMNDGAFEEAKNLVLKENAELLRRLGE